ncbi:uncharacterized protein PV07_03893 [Cladophialophora immunda]|uniref:Uncharacterized protein n=1 Tax=Cladophialophora immunda TaxID=569365 RepID=A0A0D2D9D6_9EURO|nr:uncharacterized protein PV07_03893 [Cladophialophora immunda]KIW32339.1 hypothetical protein PV07_03893 [Cladophialophora immunda]
MEEVPNKSHGVLPKLAREALQKMTCQDPSQPASEEDTAAADILHDCNLVIGLSSRVSDWKEKNAQTTRALRELRELGSYLEDARWDGLEKPDLLLRTAWALQHGTVVALARQERAIASDVNAQLGACRILFKRRGQTIPDFVSDNARFMAKINKTHDIGRECMRLNFPPDQEMHVYKNVLMMLT